MRIGTTAEGAGTRVGAEAGGGATVSGEEPRLRRRGAGGGETRRVSGPNIHPGGFNPSGSKPQLWHQSQSIRTGVVHSGHAGS